MADRVAKRREEREISFSGKSPPARVSRPPVILQLTRVSSPAGLVAWWPGEPVARWWCPRSADGLLAAQSGSANRACPGPCRAGGPGHTL